MMDNAIYEIHKYKEELGVHYFSFVIEMWNMQCQVWQFNPNM